ncbi:unnamed protein product [Caretta caretta]
MAGPFSVPAEVTQDLTSPRLFGAGLVGFDPEAEGGGASLSAHFRGDVAESTATPGTLSPDGGSGAGPTRKTPVRTGVLKR